MTGRPYVLLSVAMSVDGHIDDATAERLVLSGPADLDRVDAVRAGVDAILVGAGTLRSDDPRLLSRRGQPRKVVLTGTGELDPTARFFTTGTAERLVYASTPAVPVATARVGHAATVVDAGSPLDLAAVLGDLLARGVRRLLVEGGQTVHTQFLTADIVDELHVVVAPFFVGDPAAPRFVGAGTFPYGPGRRMRLAEARPVGDDVLLRYLLAGP